MKHTLIITSISSAYKKLGIFDDNYNGLMDLIFKEGLIKTYSMVTGCVNYLSELTKNINKTLPKGFVPDYEIRVLFNQVISEVVDQREAERYFIKRAQSKMPEHELILYDLKCGLVESYIQTYKSDNKYYQQIVFDLTPLSEQEYAEFTKEFNKIYPQCPSNIHLYRG